MRLFKGLLQWVEGIESKNDLVYNWSATSMGAFRRHLQWIEGIEDKIDLVINLSIAYAGAFKKFYTMDWRYCGWI